MQLDLILATINRKQSLLPLMDSLASQTYKNFRILLVDQNPLGYLDDILDYCRSLSFFPEIVYLRSNPGLSRARNVGLQHLDGDFFGLLDDDVIYCEDTVEKAVKALLQSDIAIGTLAETALGDCLKIKEAEGRSLKTIYEAFYQAPSVTLFFRKQVALDLDEGFPEDIGAGSDSIYGSGAETDFLIRAIQAGFQAKRYPEIVVHHPPIDVTAPGAFTKARRYGRGRWYIIQKYNIGAWFIVANALYALFKIVRKPFCYSYVRYQWEQFLGRLGK